ncbi:MAG: hypothetical protein WDW38_010854 [Sanguina aurantia]
MAENKVMWFRKGLRLHDNPALLEACKDAASVYPIYILDPYFLTNTDYKVGVNRYNFLLESLADLDESLKARGSRLLVLRGKPEEVLPRVLKDWSISTLCFEVDTEPYAKARDARVAAMASSQGVNLRSFVSHTLYDTASIVRRNGGKVPLTMGSFNSLVDRIGDPPAPAPGPPSAIPPPAEGAAGTAAAETRVPTCAEMGFKDAPTSVFKGGETAALARLNAAFADPKWVAGFQKPDTNPSDFLKPSTTVLSPYLKFGCLSARLFHHRILEVYKTHSGHSTPPQSLRGQLLWREFFYTVGEHTPNFQKMEGNAICRQVPWDTNPEFLAAFKEGRTGFPWIDAIMVQLREWGWMHHLARHSVACFLTRGDLYLSWEEGRDVFEELLIDGDFFVNSANWMWLSASAFFNQYFRVYSPIKFGQKYDKEGKFIRNFLPVLKDMPAKYIYEPWTAPLEVQRKAKCIIGVDYPHPIVDHAIAHKEGIRRMALAYKAGKADVDEDDSKAAAGDNGSPAAAKKAPVKRAAKKVVAAAASVVEKAVSAAAGAASAATEALTGAKAKRQRTLLETGVTKTAAKAE